MAPVENLPYLAIRILSEPGPFQSKGTYDYYCYGWHCFGRNLFVTTICHSDFTRFFQSELGSKPSISICYYHLDAMHWVWIGGLGAVLLSVPRLLSLARNSLNHRSQSKFTRG